MAEQNPAMWPLKTRPVVGGLRQRCGRVSLVQGPEDHLPILPGAEDRQEREVFSFDPVEDQMFRAWMDADGRIEFGTLARYLRREGQPFEGVLEALSGCRALSATIRYHGFQAARSAA